MQNICEAEEHDSALRFLCLVKHHARQDGGAHNVIGVLQYRFSQEAENPFEIECLFG